MDDSHLSHLILMAAEWWFFNSVIPSTFIHWHFIIGKSFPFSYMCLLFPSARPHRFFSVFVSFFMDSHFVKGVIILLSPFILMLRWSEKSSLRASSSWLLCPPDTSTGFLGTWLCFDPHLSSAITWFACIPSPSPTPQPVLESVSELWTALPRSFDW